MAWRDLLWWVPAGSVPEVSAQELAEQLQRAPPPQLLDVRTPAEWSRSRIEGAISAPIHELRKRLQRGLDLDRTRPVVAICRSAHRSIPAVRLLRRNHFTDAVQLRGGMLAWWAAGLPTVGDQGTRD